MVVELHVKFLSVELVELLSRQVEVVYKTDEVWVIGSLIYIPRLPVINYLVVVPVWAVGTSFNNFSAFCDKRVDLAEVVDLN